MQFKGLLQRIHCAGEHPWEYDTMEELKHIGRYGTLVGVLFDMAFCFGWVLVFALCTI